MGICFTIVWLLLMLKLICLYHYIYWICIIIYGEIIFFKSFKEYSLQKCNFCCTLFRNFLIRFKAFQYCLVVKMYLRQQPSFISQTLSSFPEGSYIYFNYLLLMISRIFYVNFLMMYLPICIKSLSKYN